MLLTTLGSFLSVRQVFAQTDEEIAHASQYIGRPQTKTSTLAFFAGFYEQKLQYDKAIDYNKRMLALFEQDLGKYSPKTAWALSKIAKCYMLEGKDSLAEPYCKRCWQILDQTSLGESRFLQFEIDALNTCALCFSKTHQAAEVAAVNLQIKRLDGLAPSQH